MKLITEGDPFLFQTNDGGNINVENGITELSSGLETAAYLSLFGGNEDDDGSEKTDKNWWGNFTETVESAQYRSETQYILRSLPATSGNLGKLREAVLRDLDWMVQDKVASEIDVNVTIPGLNKVMIECNINAIGPENQFVFYENWKASI